MAEIEAGCVRFRAVSAEFALGVLPAEERDHAMAHLDACAACRAYQRADTAVADGLLALYPANEPSIGFEQRVAARIGQRNRKPPRTLRRSQGTLRRSQDRSGTQRWGWLAGQGRLALAAAAVLVFALGALAGGLLMGRAPLGGGPPAAGPPAASVPPLRPSTVASGLLDAPLLAEGRPVGEVYAYAGSPAWVYMSVDLGRGGDPLSCQLLRRDGTSITIGSFPVTAGRGYWGAPSPVLPDTLAGARVLAADGTLLATATFDRGH